MTRFVLWGEYCENALEKREPFREEHLRRLTLLKEKGTLVTLGPTKCTSYVFGIFEANSLDDVKRLIAEDVYTKQKIWIKTEIFQWVQAF